MKTVDPDNGTVFEMGGYCVIKNATYAATSDGLGPGPVVGSEYV